MTAGPRRIHPNDRGSDSARALVESLVHEWCNRPHESCVCQSNPLRGGKPLPVSVSGRERERLIAAARVILGEAA